jgi:ABC-2 type transport system permease protein
MSTVDAEISHPPLTRLTLVELRKMVDTLAGFWLQLITVILMVAVVGLTAKLGDPVDQSFDQMLDTARVPGAFLLPVVGILLVTSEWSQRTALITFTVNPRRLEVLAVKFLAGVLLALATMLLALVLAAAGTAIAGGEWNGSLGVVGQIALSLVFAITIGVAFGAAIKTSAPAIVLYFVLPIAFSALGTISAFNDAALWLDTSHTFEPLPDHVLHATEWARLATSLGLWLLLPLVIGAWRITQEDVS